MSLAENLLNSLDATSYKNMRTAGSVEEEHIIVGKDRVITVPNALKTIAVKGDKDVETATIDCIRYWDENDLSTFAIYLNYILPNGDEGTYIPKTITKSDDFFSFDWEIGSEFTYAQGKLTFWIVTKLTDDNGELVKQWSSFQNSDCSIAQGGDKIYVPEKQTDQDVISQAISISRASAETAEKQAILAIEAANKAALDASQAAEEEVSRIIGELGVVQELGNSPNSVVSQAKVTKEFFNANAKIDRNFKAIENIKADIPADEFETDDSVAYQKDVPANALPYAAVQKVGGMTYKNGDTLKSAPVTEVESVGANLFDNSAINFTSSNLSLRFETERDYVRISGTKASGANVVVIKKQNIILPAGKYTIFIKFVSGTINARDSLEAIYFGINDSTYAMRTTGVIKAGDIGTRTFTLEQDTVLSSYNITPGYSGVGSVFNDVILACMLVRGDVANDFTPYVRQTLPIPEAVRNLDGYGLGVSDTVYNYIDWEKKQFVKRVGKVVFTGTESWTLWNSNMHTTKLDVVAKSSSEVLSNCTYPSRMGSGTNALYFKTEGAFDVDAWKGYLATQYANGNPVTLVYELATPEVTDISDLITADNLIGVEGGGTLTFENEHKYAVPSEVEYQVEV